MEPININKNVTLFYFKLADPLGFSGTGYYKLKINPGSLQAFKQKYINILK